MKKCISILLAVMLIFSLSIPAYAADKKPSAAFVTLPEEVIITRPPSSTVLSHAKVSTFSLKPLKLISIITSVKF